MTRSSFLLSVTVSLAATASAYAQAPAIGAGGIINGADFQANQPITPGSLISIFGTSLASASSSASTIPISTTLGGVTVQFSAGSVTENAPLTFVSSGQLNVQVPWDIVQPGASQQVSVIVTNNGAASPAANVMVGPFSPGIFAFQNFAIAVNSPAADGFNSDGTLAEPVGAIPGLTTHPAKPGDALVIYCTGLGALDNMPANGAASLDMLRNTLTQPVVTVGGITAQVLFSGLSPQFVGVNQVNIVVPNVPAGDAVPLQFQMGGIMTPSNITIAIGQ